MLARVPYVRVLATAGLATLVVASPAQAGLQQEFSVFSDCPLNVPSVTTCAYSTVTSGEFALGSKTVEINKTVTLQGGIAAPSSILVPAADGKTLSHTPLTVPGGLVGIEGLGGEVTATAELAGAVEINGGDLLNHHGTAVSLPLKIKLDNPTLGSGCYIGSGSQPVSPQLTTGTTMPPPPTEAISGSVGQVKFAARQNISIVSASLVDNAFSVPGANGCGGLLSLALDPLVDASAGVPSAAGKNVAIMNGVLETAPASAVRAQQALPEVGRCVPAESSGEGKAKVYRGAYENTGCTAKVEEGNGKYEWLAGAGAKDRFTGKGTAATLQGVGGASVKCKASKLTGEYTGTKTTAATFAFTGCKGTATNEPCESSGARSGEIITSSLTGGLGFIEDQLTESTLLVSVGVDLGQQPSLLRAECASVKETLVVEGSVIAPIAKLDKMSKTFSLSYSASGGKQAPEQFEGGANDTLTATLGSGAEQAGLTTVEKITNEEPLEIKAESEG